MAEFEASAQRGAVGRERKEVLGPNLKIARLIPPKTYHHKVAEIVGIPFEESQLRPFAVDVNGKSTSLLTMMGSLDLIGETEGVPHLSVGGSSRSGGSVDSGAARSYLVGDGYGIKGAGLVRYSLEGGQTGFGLGDLLNRDMGTDIAGGIRSSVAVTEFDRSSRLSLLFQLNTGESKCARFLKVFDYQPWHALYNQAQTSLLIREDGKRGVPKKNLVNAIHDALPTLTDFREFPKDFFEGDGHNAFLRDGKVIFTDYEANQTFVPEYVDYMAKLGNTWYFEELRKRYPKFLELYSLHSTGIIDYSQLGQVEESVRRYVGESRLGGAVEDAITRGDTREIVRYAMAGVIASRANARVWGQEMLGDYIVEGFRDGKLGDTPTLKDVEEFLKTVTYPGMEEADTNEWCRVTRDEAGNLVFNMHLNNFGLPIDPNVAVAVTSADVYEAWNNATRMSSKKRSLRIPQQEGNIFENFPSNLFSRTLYPVLSGTLLNLKTQELYTDPIDQTLVGYNSQAFHQGLIDYGAYFINLETDFSTPTTFLFGNTLRVSFDGNALRIEGEREEMKNFSTTDLNKFAYAAHVAAEFLKDDASSGPRVIRISSGSEN